MDRNEAFWSVAELAWLAGFIDGEGSINASESNGRDQLRLTLTNTDIRVLYWVKRTFNAGSVRPRKTKKKPANHKDVCEWVSGYYAAVKILKACLPYMKVKHRQAKKFIECAGLMRSDSLEAFKRRTQLIIEIQELNKRGVEVPNASDDVPVYQADRRANGADDARPGSDARLRQDPGGNAP